MTRSAPSVVKRWRFFKARRGCGGYEWDLVDLKATTPAHVCCGGLRRAADRGDGGRWWRLLELRIGGIKKVHPYFAFGILGGLLIRINGWEWPKTGNMITVIWHGTGIQIWILSLFVFFHAGLFYIQSYFFVLLTFICSRPNKKHHALAMYGNEAQAVRVNVEILS